MAGKRSIGNFNKNAEAGSNKGSGKDPNKPLKNPLVYIAAIALGVSLSLFGAKEEAPTDLEYSEFLDKIKTEQVDNLKIREREVSGDLYRESDTLAFVTTIPPQENVVERLVDSNVNYESEIPKETNWGLITSLLFIAPIFLIAYFILKNSKNGNSPFSMGKSLVKEIENVEVTFADVAGVDEAKQDLSEIVEFLNNPERFTRVGARIPRGILMEGPPGTGKTLMAKALAGEAGVPFFSVSGSAFVEMYVGRGAARVRDMFKTVKEKDVPCILFIDEIDAIGGKRGGTGSANNDEKDQALNEILTQMDGMDERDNVIVIAATNRADMLDDALTRPGRFDRKVSVGLPDVRGRRMILDVHANIKNRAASKAGPISEMADNSVFDPAIDWDVIAAATPGFSGAELENMINEASIFAARRDAVKIGQDDLEEARDKILMGARSSAHVSEKRKELVAWHEAAHTVVAYELREHASPIHKVTLIPRGPAAGALFHLPRENEIRSVAHLKADMAVAMAGRMGEEALYGAGSELVTAGAQSDIQQATDMAEKMISAWGMSNVTGMRNYRSNPGSSTPSRAFGVAAGDRVDKEIDKLLSEAIETARKILKKREPQLKALVKALYEYETLDALEVDKVMKGLPVGRLPTEAPSNDNQIGNNKSSRQHPPRQNLG